MPTSRRRNNQNTSYADMDSDGDTEREQTPRPTATTSRTFSKKRLSERVDLDSDFTPENSQSSPANARPPLKSVHINDDIAEKRLRRKSARMALPDLEDDTQAGPSSDNGDVTHETARGSNLARQKSSLLAVPQAPVINVPMDVMTSNFDQWMKMATDNKINAANSWNFALIDYFHDMSLLRNNTDNSINFQRASCTLDGCVKIWTSRVDSVGAETGKLLSNLANRNPNDEEGNASDNPDGADPTQSQRKRKAYRSESTLAKNAAQLRTKKLDLEFSVDPLFRKTCADFDEGGAQGLLMNHLGLTVTPDGHLRVVFDASDSVAKDDEEEMPLQEPPDDVDLGHLRENFMKDLSFIDDLEISESLEGFKFGEDTSSIKDTAFRNALHTLDDDDDDIDNDGFDDQVMDDVMNIDGVSAGVAAAHDFFVGEQAVPDDYDDAGADYSGDGDNAVGAPPEQRQAGFVPFDPRRMTVDRDMKMAMAINDADGEGMLNYFDPAFLKNWAGPEHWKLRKVVRRPAASEVAAARPKREKKEAFKIDFLSPPDEDIKTRQKTLFAPVTRGAGINLPGPSVLKTARKGGRARKGKKDKEDKRNDQTLPDDMHFSSKQLVSLFLKPKFSLKVRGQQVRPDGDLDGEVDDAMWARVAAKQAAGVEPGDETADGGGIPFATQFFHDDDDDDGPAFDEVAPVDPGEQDLLASTQGQTRRIKPEAVNYTKRAKRVDVRKLKENIWKGLDIVAPAVEGEGEDAMDTDERPSTDPEEGRSFNSVISDLHQSYPKDKMEEISTSFCFICLLHLANERGLKLEVGEHGEQDDDDDMVTEAVDHKVGNLWNLKVYRDPNATPAS